jgi:hypothetical protein
MGAVVNMLDYRSVDVPDVDQMRVELDPDGYLSVTFIGYSQLPIRCAKHKLPSWVQDKLQFLQDKITEFEDNSVGVKISESVYYIYIV